MRSLQILLLLSCPAYLVTFVIFPNSLVSLQYVKNSHSRGASRVQPTRGGSESEIISFLTSLELLQSPTSSRKKRNENISSKDRKQLHKDSYDLNIISARIETLRYENLPLEQISRLCFSLGSLGINNLDFQNNVWNILENHVSNIDRISPKIETSALLSKVDSGYSFDDHIDNVSETDIKDNNDGSNNSVETNDVSKETEIVTMKKNRIYLDLLSGLVGMSVKWKILSPITKENMENVICDLLVQFTETNKKIELFSLLINIGNLYVPIKELKNETKKILCDAIIYTAMSLPASRSIYDIFYSLGKMNIIFSSDFTSIQQHHLKILISKHFSRNNHHEKFSKGLHGLAGIGLKWSLLDVNIRYKIFYEEHFFFF